MCMRKNEKPLQKGPTRREKRVERILPCSSRCPPPRPSFDAYHTRPRETARPTPRTCFSRVHMKTLGKETPTMLTGDSTGSMVWGPRCFVA